jgi:hypothetical protein
VARLLAANKIETKRAGFCSGRGNRTSLGSGLCGIASQRQSGAGDRACYRIKACAWTEADLKTRATSDRKNARARNAGRPTAVRLTHDETERSTRWRQLDARSARHETPQAGNENRRSAKAKSTRRETKISER